MPPKTHSIPCVFSIPFRTPLRAFDPPALDANAPRCTTQQHKTHNTDLGNLTYPWHPWFNQRVVIHESLTKSGQALFRCSLPEEAQLAGLDIPQWMFDLALCCTMQLQTSPWVHVDALRQLRQLLQLAKAAPRNEVDHAYRSSPVQGDDDAQENQDADRGAVEPVCSSAAATDVGTAAPAGAEKSDRTPRRVARRKTKAKHKTSKRKGGRR